MAAPNLFELIVERKTHSLLQHNAHCVGQSNNHNQIEFYFNSNVYKYLAYFIL